MNMPDKDIDNLFRSTLENFEAKPSARVWEAISEELHEDKRRRMVPLWSIAASIILFLAAGAYFMLPQKKAGQAGGGQRTLASNTKAHAQSSTAVNIGSAAKTGTQAPVNTIVGTQPAQQIAAQPNRSQPAATMGKPQNITQPNHPVVVDQPASVAINNEQLIAASTVKVPVNTPVVPDTSIPLNPKTITADVQTPVMASTADSQVNKSARKHHGAFTLGDLINTVVATVDKRADKVIEFTDTDDEQSNITGINLGIIKIKKNNNK